MLPKIDCILAINKSLKYYQFLSLQNSFLILFKLFSFTVLYNTDLFVTKTIETTEEITFQLLSFF